MTKVSEATAARLKAFHPDIPEERLPAIVARSLIGALLSVVGLALMGAASVVTLSLLADGKAPGALGLTALAVLGALGAFLFAWGLLTAAGRLVKKPLELAIATMKGVFDVWRKRNGS